MFYLFNYLFVYFFSLLALISEPANGRLLSMLRTWVWCNSVLDSLPRPLFEGMGKLPHILPKIDGALIWRV